MKHLTEWDHWEVTLTTGVACDVWADGYEELGGSYVFGALVEVDTDPPPQMTVTARTPTDEARVVIAVARFPAEAVDRVLAVTRSSSGR